MKMASGYFAYHGIIEFNSGITIEVQIYSSLMSSWSKLSHKLYEKARIRTKNKELDFGTTETRLISLGHLLHLAECELLDLIMNYIKLPPTHATSNLGIRLNLKLVLYLEDLANPNNGLNLVPNPL